MKESEKIIKYCENPECGKKVERTPNRIKWSKHLYCSHKCRAQVLKKTVIKYCENPGCGKKVERSISRFQDGKHTFCSRKCKEKACEKKITKYCANPACKKRMKRTPTYSQGEHAYCSRKCQMEVRSAKNSTVKYCGNPDCKKEIKRASSKMKKKNAYCSKQCSTKMQIKKSEEKKIKCTCQNCGKPIKKTPSDFIKANKMHFCDEICQGAFLSFEGRKNKVCTPELLKQLLAHTGEKCGFPGCYEPRTLGTHQSRWHVCSKHARYISGMISREHRGYKEYLQQYS